MNDEIVGCVSYMKRYPAILGVKSVSACKHIDNVRFPVHMYIAAQKIPSTMVAGT